MKLRGILLAMLVILAGAVAVLAQGDLTWKTETVGQGIRPAIAVDASGGVHLAYLVQDFGGSLLYNTNVSGSWQENVVADGYFDGPARLALSADGIPYIAYHDYQSATFDPALGDEVVATLANGTWQLLTVSNPGPDGLDNSIAVDADGFWHTSSIDPAQFGSTSGVEYATNAFGGVVVEQIGSGPQPYEFGTSIKVRADGVVGITYSDERNRDLIYAERSPGQNGTWTLTTVDSEGDVGRYSALAFDSAGNPHITYFRNDTGTSGMVRYAWRDANGAWQFSDVGSLDYVISGTDGARKITSIALDGNDQVHVVFGDQAKIVYAVQNVDGTWSQQTVVESTAQDLGQSVGFALGGDGRPQIVYFVVKGTHPLVGDIVYATAGS